MNPVQSYLKNLGKSIVYAASDYVEKTAPGIAEFKDVNKEAFKDIAAGIRNYKSSYNKSARALEQSPIYKVGSQIWNSTITGLKTGKWYNESSDEDDMFGFGQSPTEQGIAGTGNGVDGEDALQSNTVSESQKSLMSFMKNSNQQSMQAMAATTEASTNYMVATAKANTNLLYGASVKQTAVMESGFSNLSNSLSALYNFNTQVVGTLAENSKKYFETTTNIMQENNAILKEMLEMQRNLYKKEDQPQNFGIMGVMGSNGMPDLKAYGSQIIKNIKNLVSEETMGASDILFDENMLKMVAVNPLAAIPAMMMNVAMGPKFKTQLQKLDKSLSGVFSTFVSRMNYAAKHGSGTAGILGKIFGVRDDTKNRIESGVADPNKAVQLDAAMRKSIVEIMPAHLARIEAALTGQPAKVFDMRTGRWTTMGQLKTNFKNVRRASVKQATMDEDAEMRQMLNMLRLDDNTRRKVLAAIEKVNDKRFEDYGHYDRSGSMRNRANRYGISDEQIMAIVDRLMMNQSKQTKMQSASKFAMASTQYKQYLRNLEKQGNVAGYLFNGFDEANALATDRIDVSKSPAGGRGVGGGLLSQKDKYGNSVFDYLKEIADNTYYGGAGTGNGTGRKRSIKSVSRQDLEYTRSAASYTAGFPHQFRTPEEMNNILAGINKTGKYVQDSSDLMMQMDNETWLGRKISAFAKHYKAPAPGKGNKADEFIQRIINAGSTGEKFGIISEGIQKLTAKPAGQMTALMAKADENIYNFFFKDEDKLSKIKTKDGKTPEGFFGKMNAGMDNVFDNLDKTISQIMNKFHTQFDAINKKYIEPITNGVKNAFGSAFTTVKDSLVGTWGMAKNAYNSFMAEPAGYADGARNVESTGLAVISKGERIIPADQNPYNPNRKTASRAQARKNEARIKAKLSRLMDSSLIATKADGDLAFGYDMGFLERKAHSMKRGLKGAKENILDKVGSATDWAKGKLNIPQKQVQQVAAQTQSVASEFVTQLFGDQKVLSDTVGKVNKDIQKHVPELAGGAAVGGAAGLILGGPLLGAVAGTAISLVQNSETMQRALFGEKVVDADGNVHQKGGLISQEVQNTVKKYFPDMKTLGISGALVGLTGLTPLGPLGGLLLGSAIGFAKNNESIQNALFGDKGVFSKNTKKILRKALPSMGLGAAVGGMTSILTSGLGMGLPVWPLAVVGAGAGLIASTDEFKDFLLGKADENGKRSGGLAGALKETIVNPLAEFANDLKNKFGDWMKYEMLEPVKNAIAPIGKTIELGLKSGIQSLTTGLKRLFDPKYGIPIAAQIGQAIGFAMKPVKGLAGKATSLAGWALSRPSAAIGAMGDRMRRSHIKSGNADYMTAEERLKFMGQEDYEHKNIDRQMAGSTVEQLESMMESFNVLQKGAGYFDDKRASVTREVGAGVTKRIKDTGRAKKIMQAILDGDTETAHKLITDSNIDTRTKKDLMSYIDKKGAELQEINAKKANYDGDRSKLFKRLDKAGFKGINESNLGKYQSSLESEIGSRRSLMKEVSEAGLTDTEKQDKANAAMISASINDNFAELIPIMAESTEYLRNIAESGGYLTDKQKSKIKTWRKKGSSMTKDISNAYDDLSKHTNKHLGSALKFDAKISDKNRYKFMEDEKLFQRTMALSRKGYVLLDPNQLLDLKPEDRDTYLTLAEYGYQIKDPKEIVGISDVERNNLYTLAKAGVRISNIQKAKDLSPEEAEVMATLYGAGFDEVSQGTLEYLAKTRGLDLLSDKETTKKALKAARKVKGKKNRELTDALHYGAGSEGFITDLDDVKIAKHDGLSFFERNRRRAGALGAGIRNRSSRFANSIATTIKHKKDRLANFFGGNEEIPTYANGLDNASEDQIAIVSQGERIESNIGGYHLKNDKPGTSHQLVSTEFGPQMYKIDENGNFNAESNLMNKNIEQSMEKKSELLDLLTLHIPNIAKDVKKAREAVESINERAIWEEMILPLAAQAINGVFSHILGKNFNIKDKLKSVGMHFASKIAKSSIGQSIQNSKAFKFLSQQFEGEGENKEEDNNAPEIPKAVDFNSIVTPIKELDTNMQMYLSRIIQLMGGSARDLFNPPTMPFGAASRMKENQPSALPAPAIPALGEGVGTSTEEAAETSGKKNLRETIKNGLESVLGKERTAQILNEYDSTKHQFNQWNEENQTGGDKAKNLLTRLLGEERANNLFNAYGEQKDKLANGFDKWREAHPTANQNIAKAGSAWDSIVSALSGTYDNAKTTLNSAKDTITANSSVLSISPDEFLAIAKKDPGFALEMVKGDLVDLNKVASGLMNNVETELGEKKDQAINDLTEKKQQLIDALTEKKDQASNNLNERKDQANQKLNELQNLGLRGNLKAALEAALGEEKAAQVLDTLSSTKDQFNEWNGQSGEDKAKSILTKILGEDKANGLFDEFNNRKGQLNTQIDEWRKAHPGIDNGIASIESMVDSANGRINSTIGTAKEAYNNAMGTYDSTKKDIRANSEVFSMFPQQFLELMQNDPQLANAMIRGDLNKLSEYLVGKYGNPKDQLASQFADWRKAHPDIDQKIGQVESAVGSVTGGISNAYASAKNMYGNAKDAYNNFSVANVYNSAKDAINANKDEFLKDPTKFLKNLASSGMDTAKNKIQFGQTYASQKHLFGLIRAVELELESMIKGYADDPEALKKLETYKYRLNDCKLSVGQGQDVDSIRETLKQIYVDLNEFRSTSDQKSTLNEKTLAITAGKKLLSMLKLTKHNLMNNLADKKKKLSVESLKKAIEILNNQIDTLLTKVQDSEIVKTLTRYKDELNRYRIELALDASYSATRIRLKLSKMYDDLSKYEYANKGILGKIAAKVNKFFFGRKESDKKPGLISYIKGNFDKGYVKALIDKFEEQIKVVIKDNEGISQMMAMAMYQDRLNGFKQELNYMNASEIKSKVQTLYKDFRSKWISGPARHRLSEAKRRALEKINLHMSDFDEAKGIMSEFKDKIKNSMKGGWHKSMANFYLGRAKFKLDNAVEKFSASADGQPDVGMLASINKHRNQVIRLEAKVQNTSGIEYKRLAKYKKEADKLLTDIRIKYEGMGIFDKLRAKKNELVDKVIPGLAEKAGQKVGNAVGWGLDKVNSAIGGVADMAGQIAANPAGWAGKQLKKAQTVFTADGPQTYVEGKDGKMVLEKTKENKIVETAQEKTKEMYQSIESNTGKSAEGTQELAKGLLPDKKGKGGIISKIISMFPVLLGGLKTVLGKVFAPVKFLFKSLKVLKYIPRLISMGWKLLKLVGGKKLAVAAGLAYGGKKLYDWATGNNGEGAEGGEPQYDEDGNPVEDTSIAGEDESGFGGSLLSTGLDVATSMTGFGTIKSIWNKVTGKGAEKAATEAAEDAAKSKGFFAKAKDIITGGKPNAAKESKTLAETASKAARSVGNKAVDVTNKGINLINNAGKGATEGAKFITESGEQIAEKGAPILKKMQGVFRGLIEKLAPITGKSCSEALGKLCEYLIKKAQEPKILKKIIKKSLKLAGAAALSAATLGVGAIVGSVITGGFVVKSFYDGYNGAEEIFDLPADTASTGIKILGGVAQAMEEIPFVGWIVPAKEFAKLIVQFIGPSIGITESDLNNIRQTGKQAVENIAKTSQDVTNGLSDKDTEVQEKGTSLLDRAKGVASGLMETAASGFKGVKDKVGSIIDKIKNTASTVMGFIRNFGQIGKDIGEFLGFGDSSSNDNQSGTGKWGMGTMLNSLFGMGSNGSDAFNQFHSQLDPINQMGFNVSTDSQKQTMADSGCGPAALANAASALGVPMDTKQAASYALSHGYKERDGGTTPGFFNSYAQQNGFNTQSIGVGSVESNLKAGKPVVLMGKDSKGGRTGKTPYGDYNHYVTATGMDSKGNIIIQDPESFTPNQKYRASDVLNKSSMAIAAGRGKWGRGRKPRYPKKYGRGNRSYFIPTYGKGRWGRGEGDTAGQPVVSEAKMWALANWASKQCGIDPKFIYGQWYHESAGFTSDLSHNYNFGGMTQTTDNGDKQPDGNNYYMHFSSPEEWAEYYSWYMNQCDGVAGVKTSAEFANALKANQYYGDDPVNYTNGIDNGINNIPAGAPDDKLIDTSQFGKREIGSPRYGTTAPATTNTGSNNSKSSGGILGELSDIIGILASGFDLSKGNKQNGPKKSGTTVPSVNDYKGASNTTIMTAQEQINMSIDKAMSKLKAGKMNVDDFIQQADMNPNTTREQIWEALEKNGFGDEDTRKYYDAYYKSIDDANNDSWFQDEVYQLKNSEITPEVFIRECSKHWSGMYSDRNAIRPALISLGMYDEDTKKYYDEYMDTEDTKGWMNGPGHSEIQLGKYGNADIAHDYMNGNIENGMNVGRGKWGRGTSAVRRAIKSIRSKIPYYKRNPSMVNSFSSNSGMGRWGRGDGTAVFNALKKVGFNDVAAAGIMGNMMQESTLDPNAENSDGYHGLVQWDPNNRWPAAQQWIQSQGMDPNSVEGQVAYVYKEAMDSGLVNKMNSCGSPEEAAQLWEEEFEKSGGSEIGKRIAYATSAFASKGADLLAASSSPTSRGGNTSSANTGGKLGILKQAAEKLSERMRAALGPLADAFKHSKLSSSFGSMAKEIFGSNPLDNIFGSGSPSSPSGSNGSSGGTTGPQSKSTNPQIRAASEYANSRVNTTGYGDTGCTEWVNDYLSHANIPNIDLYVPNAKQNSENQTYPYRFKQPSEGAVEGDIAVLETSGVFDPSDPDHVVIADGQGGYWGNSSSRNMIVHGDLANDYGANNLYGYIATGGDGAGNVVVGESNRSQDELIADAGSTSAAGKWGRGRFGLGNPYGTAQEILPSDNAYTKKWKENYNKQLKARNEAIVKHNKVKIKAAQSGQGKWGRGVLGKLRSAGNIFNSNIGSRMRSGKGSGISKFAVNGAPTLNSISDMKQYIQDVPAEFIDPMNMPDWENDSLTVLRAKVQKIRKLYDAELAKNGMTRNESIAAARTIDPNNIGGTSNIADNAARTLLPGNESQISETPAAPTTQVATAGAVDENSSKFDMMVQLLASIDQSLKTLVGLGGGEATNAAPVANVPTTNGQKVRGLNKVTDLQRRSDLSANSFESIARMMNMLATK